MKTFIRRLRPGAALALAVLALAACQTTTTANAGSQLTAEEVRNTFIDREWS